nr:uncharacterized protein LOC113728837 [Coffea arabica]
MAREKQVVYSFSSSDEMEVNEDIEKNEEERSHSPQSIRKQQRKGTSRSAETAIFDSAKFTSLRNQEWHEVHANLEFLFEMHVSSKIEVVYCISEAFNQLGWAPILTLPTHYYPDLICEFYANIDNKPRHSGKMVESWVRERGIILSRECLAAILGCNNQGRVIDLKKDFVTPNRWWDPSHA